MAESARIRLHRTLTTLGALAVLGLTACDGILDVDDSDVIVPSDLDAAGPAAVPTLVNGIIGSYQNVMGPIVLYTAMFTDEMIRADNFPTRAQVDDRRVDPNNGSLTTELYAPLHRARFLADTTAFALENRLADPAFAGVVDGLLDGIALGRLYGGYTRLWLAELYCWSILTGMYPEASPRLPNERMLNAIEFLEAAESLAEGRMEDVRLAAVVGQARAHLWRGDFERAAELAEAVPPTFAFMSEHSGTHGDQYNSVYGLTWGDLSAIRWTVGDGSSLTRGEESWEHLEEFLALNLLSDRPSGFTANDASVPVVLQMLYNRSDSDILMASGAEAALVRAEVAVRNGETEMAQALLNELRSDYSARAETRWRVDPPDTEDQLQSLVLSGDLASDLKAVVDERARELWLTGDRHTTSRRLRLDTGVPIDLWPEKSSIEGGDDIAFPMVQRELDNNSRLAAGEACPPGQSLGSWR